LRTVYESKTDKIKNKSADYLRDQLREISKKY